jgi:apolipoprotein D and lipocalin family protein
MAVKYFCGLIVGFSMSFLSLTGMTSCTTTASFDKTVPQVDLARYLTKWYVISSRPTSFEENAFGAVESYSWNQEKSQIDIDFYFHEGAVDGPLKKIPQTAWVFNETTKSHWKVKPNWWWFPFKMDYLIIALDADYRWVCVGVPDQKYLWIMSTTPQMDEATLSGIVAHLNSIGYDTKGLKRVTH